jgi:hypothetical protein
MRSTRQVVAGVRVVAAPCPAGSIWDGAQGRPQRGIIIDQRKPNPSPEPRP